MTVPSSASSRRAHRPRISAPQPSWLSFAWATARSLEVTPGSVTEDSASGAASEGADFARLPSETDLHQKYDVASMTARKVVSPQLLAGHCDLRTELAPNGTTATAKYAERGVRTAACSRSSAAPPRSRKKSSPAASACSFTRHSMRSVLPVPNVMLDRKLEPAARGKSVSGNGGRCRRLYR